MESSRRDFLKKATATGAAILAAPAVFGTVPFSGQQKTQDATTPFKLKYAPSLGMFSEHAGKDPIDNIKFCHDMGFRAMFDNGLPGRPVAEQAKIAAELQRLGMDFGPFVLYADFSVTSFVLNKPILKICTKTKKKANKAWLDNRRKHLEIMTNSLQDPPVPAY